MANYTGLSELKNHVHRSGFDISQKHCFSAKVGEILPTYWDISMNGDKYTLRPEYFTRTRPVQTSAYTRIREYWDVYAVPLRLLWKSAPSALTQMGEQNPLQATALGDWLTVSTGLPSFTLQELGQAVARVNKLKPIANPSGDDLDNRDNNWLNQFGFSRGSCAYKLLSYLGYGNCNVNQSEIGSDFNWTTDVDNMPFYSQKYLKNFRVNALPLLAYNKIYQDFFRWDQWEKPDPSSYNVDYYDGQLDVSFFGTLPAASDDYWNAATMFDLRYCNYKKDLLMGVLPNSQFGDVSMVTASIAPSSSLRIPEALMAMPLVDENGVQVTIGSLLPNSTSSYGVKPGEPDIYWSSGNSLGVIANPDSNGYFSAQDLANLRTQFSILTLRQQMAVQKWKEITQSNDYDYVSQVQAHTGVKLSKALSNKCRWIGGISRNLDISEVINTALDGDNEANIKGKGIGSGTDSFTFEVDEPSVIMVIYHSEPVLDYVLDAPDPQLFATDTTSLPIPEFDNIGMESISLLQFFNSNQLATVVQDSATSNFFIGYQPRYYNWKTKVDKISGAFTSNLTDRSWVAPFDIRELMTRFIFANFADGSAPQATAKFEDLFNYNFFKINPHILDSIFVAQADSTFETDQLLINSYCDVHVVRNLSRDGIEY